MKATGWIVLVLIVGWGCGKDDPGPPPVIHTSVDGIWTFATPGNNIIVEFELNTSSTTGELEIINSSIEVDGTSGAAAGQLTNVDLPAIEKIRINANDAALTYNYSITFNICSVSSDFKVITVSDAEYTYPWGQIKTLSGISITRK